MGLSIGTTPPSDYKICTRCGAFTNEFHTDKKSADGRKSWCKACVELRRVPLIVELAETKELNAGAVSKISRERLDALTKVADVYLANHPYEESRLVRWRGVGIGFEDVFALRKFLGRHKDSILVVSLYVGSRVPTVTELLGEWVLRRRSLKWK